MERVTTVYLFSRIVQIGIMEDQDGKSEFTENAKLALNTMPALIAQDSKTALELLEKIEERIEEINQEKNNAHTKTPS